MREKKLAEIIKKIKKHVNNLDKIHEIVMKSTDKSDFVIKMFEEVDNFMKDLVKNDNFFKKIEEETVEFLKGELKPFFEETYVPQFFVSFYNF